MYSNLIQLEAQKRDANLFAARVQSVDDALVLVNVGGAILSATRAVSCLVGPQVDDTVLVSESGAGCHVLAILVRNNGSDLAIDVPGDLSLNAAQGRIAISASQAIDLSAGSRIRVASEHAEVRVRQTSWIGALLSARIGKLKLSAESTDCTTDRLNLIAKNVVQSMHSLMRSVRDVEILDAGSLVHRIKSGFLSNANQAVITARKDLRFDGERIHMG